jgi:serine/threonine protein kinase
MDKKEQTVTLVVEYMDGGSLQDIVETGGCDCEPVLANICARVLSGLAFLHAGNKLHRDIKPANLLINHHGNVKISDLGIVRDLDDDATAAETFTGTYTFMSPERISGQRYSYTSDVWSLGLTVMTVALGKFPFEKESEGG